LPGRTVTGPRAEALLALYEKGSVGSAHLGAIRANPSFDRTPALAFAMRPGAAIDRGMFGRTRALSVTPSAEGLARLRLTPDDLATLRPDHGDLRVADEHSRQWPYLLVDDAARAEVPLTISGPKSAHGTSKYVLTVPSGPTVFADLVLDAGAPFFDRAFTLTADRGDKSHVTLAQGRLVRAGGEAAPVEIRLGSERVERMELTMEDGDDAPLAPTSVVGRAPVVDLYVAAPQGTYTLLLEAPDVERPRYELERVRDVVLSVDAEEVKAGALEKNSASSLTSRLARGPGRQNAVMWVVLIAAVVFLTVFTLRLARR
ncbi:MAG TPA: hypothetical protein VJ826_13490, partial [Candidatus Polarisedimenticolaceae bacterium]|nr:hypothetical protein [Candidatus Polarisedimenticolaceae bacterium]